jgi:hypothetical protein
MATKNSERQGNCFKRARGLLIGSKRRDSDASNRVTYLKEETFQHYAEFRAKLQELISSRLLDEQKATILSEGIAPFDRVFSGANPSFSRSKVLATV